MNRRPSLIRQVVCFILAGGLFGSGAWMIYDELFAASFIMGRVMLMGLSLTLLGGYWLWIDFAAPALRGLGVKIDPHE